MGLCFFPLANSGLIAGFVTTGTIFVVKGEKFTVGRRLVVFSTSKIDEVSVSLPVGGCVVCFLIIVVVVVVAATALVLVVGIVCIVSGSVGMPI